MEDIEKMLSNVINKKQIYKNEPMSKHTSFKIGGNADVFVKITTIDDLKAVLEFTNEKKIPLTIIGNGTNLLVQDGGIRGIVIKLELKDFKIKRMANEVQITVESGMSLAMLSSIAIKEELTGFEFAAGIPGTVGGALRMNAGCYGSEMKDVVVKSRYMTKDGKIKTLDLKDHKFEYRNSIFSKKDYIIVDTTISLQKGNVKDIKAKIEEYNTSRREKQPLDYPSAGSTFKRIEGIPTAKLIDDAGLKGYNVGDAEVSRKHAGFIINKGKATAQDVLDLVEYVKKQVKEKFNVDIQLEILVLGEKK